MVGNDGLLAAYLLMNVALAGYAASTNVRYRLLYLSAAGVNLLGLVYASNRSTIIGLVLGAIVGGVIFAALSSSKKKMDRAVDRRRIGIDRRRSIRRGQGISKERDDAARSERAATDGRHSPQRATNRAHCNGEPRLTDSRIVRFSATDWRTTISSGARTLILGSTRSRPTSTIAPITNTLKSSPPRA